MELQSGRHGWDVCPHGEELLQQRRRSALSASQDAPLGGPSVSSASRSRHVRCISGPGVPRGPQSEWVSGHGVLALASLRVDSSLADTSPPRPGADSVSWLTLPLARHRFQEGPGLLAPVSTAWQSAPPSKA